MHVQVDEAGADDESLGVDDFCCIQDFRTGAFCYLSVYDVEVADFVALVLGVDDAAVSYVGG